RLFTLCFQSTGVTVATASSVGPRLSYAQKGKEEGKELGPVTPIHGGSRPGIMARFRRFSDHWQSDPVKHLHNCTPTGGTPEAPHTTWCGALLIPSRTAP